MFDKQSIIAAKQARQNVAVTMWNCVLHVFVNILCFIKQASQCKVYSLEADLG